MEEPTENAVTEVREKTGRGKDRFKISELFLFNHTLFWVI